jgi:hypothetical protein
MRIPSQNIIHFDPLMKVQDDGLFIPEVRSWSLEKYKLVGSYCDIFTSGMKKTFHYIIFLSIQSIQEVKITLLRFRRELNNNYI